MRWYEKLYIGESVKDAKKIRWKINHNAGTPDIYVIAFASNPDNLLDIIPSWNLLLKGYPKKKLRIIGLAAGYAEAISLAQRIIEETYAHTHDVDVWRYLKEDRRTVS